MISLKNTQRTNVVKIIHDWQNNGKQNLQFQEAEVEIHIHTKDTQKLIRYVLLSMG